MSSLHQRDTLVYLRTGRELRLFVSRIFREADGDIFELQVEHLLVMVEGGSRLQRTHISNRGAKKIIRT